ncbi:uncharacterized protein BDR25DRAFT_341026 [Lindgomyces ingoldianus]|uniref:Uncharacterized protein n=1 Tax=Lindgomyces ingoldianus TaxID=673940 RepID=A0ACB6R3L7_9PLEO|nr:uncharacterized protein BDR25DRAFT_341026 [Lindgomyces ingoldianus]KAF2473741.1 hypothetical protein BDR25DRAFT_341026 [Lindgomyces ingoldianus]
MATPASLTTSNGPPSDGPRIILGIDYGTTYTGLAWAQKRGAHDVISVDNLNVFKKWPARSESKVPSAISYSWSPNGCAQWGFDIDNDAKIFKWTKLELTTRDSVKELKVLLDLMNGLELIQRMGKESEEVGSEEVPDHLTKSPENVLTDYLMKLSREWYEHMHSGGINTLANVPLDLVITHPVNWSYEALNKTYRAVMAAFPKRMYGGLRHVYMTTEPEACSTYTVQELLNNRTNKLIPGDCFVLCDAGGGTVDVASYVVESLQPLKLTRVGNLKGRECGATCVDREFLEWCSKNLKRIPRKDIIESDSTSGGHFIVKPTGRWLLDEFERNKHAFSGVESADIELPEDINDASGAPEDDDSDSGMISISTQELLSMFHSSVMGTVELIKKQVIEVRKLTYGGGPCHVSTIFLAGGLSLNPYLVNKVKAFARGNGNILVSKPKDGWSAVVQGAVLTGAGVGTQIPPKVSQVPRYYGICVNQVYEDFKHGDRADVVIDKYHGKRMARDPMSWLVNQGDLILPGKSITRNFAVLCKFTPRDYEAQGVVRITFVAARADQGAPTRLSDISKSTNTVKYMDVPVTTFDMKSLSPEKFAQGRGKYFSVRVNVKIRVSTSVKVDIEYKGRSVYLYESSL